METEGNSRRLIAVDMNEIVLTFDRYDPMSMIVHCHAPRDGRVARISKEFLEGVLKNCGKIEQEAQLELFK